MRNRTLLRSANAGRELALLPVFSLLLTGMWTAAAAQSKTQAPPVQITLKQAVNRALTNSRELSLARLQYELSQRDAGLTRSQFLPNLYAGSGAAYTSGFPLLAGGGAPALFSLSYSQALLDTAARGDVRAAQQRAEQERLAMDGVRDGIIVRAASAYLELAKVRRELELLQAEQDSAQKIVDYTRQRLDAGYELPIELTKAQLMVAKISQRKAHLEDQDDTLADQLRTTLRLDPDQPIEVVAEDIPPAAGQAVSELVGAALQSNVELKQAESARTANEARLKGQKGSYWPTVSLIGQYNVLAKFNNYDQFFNRFERNNFIAGVEVRIPVFAAHNSAAVAYAQTSLKASEMVVENKRALVSLDVRHKARQATEMDLGREVARLELDLAQQNLQVLQAQYQQGRASLRDMESAQLDENDKWLAFLDSDLARQQAQLDLLQSTGQIAKLLQ